VTSGRKEKRKENCLLTRKRNNVRAIPEGIFRSFVRSLVLSFSLSLDDNRNVYDLLGMMSIEEEGKRTTTGSNVLLAVVRFLLARSPRTMIVGRAGGGHRSFSHRVVWWLGARLCCAVLCCAVLCYVRVCVRADGLVRSVYSSVGNAGECRSSDSETLDTKRGNYIGSALFTILNSFILLVGWKVRQGRAFHTASLVVPRAGGAPCRCTGGVRSFSFP